jgi:hypothetical protein
VKFIVIEVFYHHFVNLFNDSDITWEVGYEF